MKKNEESVMKLPRAARKWLPRVIKAVVVIELAWLLLINAALQLPLTQDAVNKIRPEKFRISWENAWSWFPARVHVSGAFANGQSRGQQWQFSAARVSGSIALLPLIAKRVWVSNVQAIDAEYRQRPRRKPGRDYSAIEAHFPDIQGREMTNAVDTPRKRRSWQVSVDDIQVRGDHRFWIFNLQGGGRADIDASLSYDTRKRILALDVDDLDLDLGPLWVNGERAMFDRGKIAGAMGFAPFAPREHKDLSMLGFLRLDIELNIDVNSLAFINLFTLDFPELAVDGRGGVDGRLRFDGGQVLQGTDLRVDAADLRVRLLSHDITGAGEVGLRVGAGAAESMELAFRYRDLQVRHETDDRPMLTGEGLVLSVGGDGRLLPDPESINTSRLIGLEVDDLAVPDLSRFQRYLPPKWSFRLHGGKGRLDGSARLTPTSLSVGLELTSDDAEVGFQDYLFRSDLAAGLNLDNPSILHQGTELGGSFIRLTDARLQRDGLEAAEPWAASLEIENGEFRLFSEQERRQGGDIRDLFEILAGAEAREALGNSSALLGFRADISSLAWIGVLLGKNSGARVSGSSRISGDFLLETGLPAPGTRVDIASEEMSVRFLDYLARGDGQVGLRVDEGDSAPDWRLGISLDGGSMYRLDEELAFMDEVDLRLSAELPALDFREGDRPFELGLQIPSARVSDMSAFNSLLPPDSSLRFASGTAALTANVLLRNDDAEGEVRLDSRGLTAHAGTQALSGDLAAELRLSGGEPAARRFDIRDSVLRLDEVRVQGEREQFDSEAWSAEIHLTRGDVTLGRPPAMNLVAELTMSDSRPFVTLFRNQQGWRPEFLARALTVEDVRGSAALDMADERLVIPEAWVVSDHIEVGAKAVITPDDRQGVMLLRYRNTDALLKFKGERRNLDILRVQEKYDNYRAGGELP
jgi:hypothetical protein